MKTVKSPRLLKTLLTTTALGGALVIAAPAIAADECGALDGGVATCTVANGPYSHISYTGVSADTTINVEAGISAATLKLEGSGDLTVNAVGTDFTGIGNGIRTIDLAGQGGTVTINAGAVWAAGVGAFAISAENDGDIVIDVDDVMVDGADGVGIAATSSADGGDISITADSIVASRTAAGQPVYGIYANGFAPGGGRANADITINVDFIDVTGGHGVQADWGGDLNVSVDKIRVTNGVGVKIGFGRDVDMAWFDTARVAVGEIELNGGTGIALTGDGRADDAEWGADFDIGAIRGTGTGISIFAYESARVLVDEIATTGGGVDVSRAAKLLVEAGTISTTADNASAIYAGSAGDIGSATLRVREVQTGGTNSAAIRARNADEIVIESESVATTGDDSPGILVEDTVSARITSEEVITQGQNSAGIQADGVDTLLLSSGAITTGGYLSHALFIESVGTASLTAETISTMGNLSVGVRVLDTDAATLDVGSVTTTGNQSHGVTLAGGTVSGRIDSIVTEGAEARGLTVAASDVDLEFGSIETFGNDASGIEAVSEDGLVRLRGDSIVTHGANARGVQFASVMGGVLEIGSVHTYGAGSDGVSASVGENISFAPSASSLLTLDIGQVVTEGEGAFGVNLNNNLGEISGHIETIETLGEYSHGLFIDQDLGSTTDLTLGSVKTHGDESVGLILQVDGGDLVVSAREVTTEGDWAHGARLELQGGVGDLSVGSVLTQGDNAFGLWVTGNEGEALVRANSVTTSGEGAYGVLLSGIDAVQMTAEVGAVTTTGDGSTAITTDVNDSESVTVKAGTITTSGADANGLYLYAQDLTLDIGRITTTGGGSTGAFLTNYGGDEESTTLRGRIGAIDTSGRGGGGLVVQHTGRFDLEVGATHTRGDDANGITVFAAGSSEAGGKLVAGSVLTEGYESIGVDLYTEYGGYDVAVQSIETRGDYSTGLDLRGGETSTIQLGTVRTSGEHADGVYASLYGLDSDLTVSADDIRTTGVNAYGLRARAEADMTLNLGYVDAAGSESDAVVAESGGALTLSASRRLGSASGVAADLTGATIDVTLASTAVVEGGSAGLVLASQDGATIRNAGSISSANGFAIEAETGRVTLDNSGLITGRIAFAGEDDVVNNSGRFAAALTSNFGGGDDVFNNTGVLSLADPTATAPRTAVFNNLERLNNAGVIDLTNGVAGDLFEVSGLINGQAGGRIALDLDLRGATPVADSIAASGFEGLSEVVLTLQGRASLGDTGVVIARSAVAQTGQEMTVRVAGGGFVGFDLAFADGEYRVSGNLTPPAFEPTKVASGAQHQWTSGADVVSARFDQMRDAGGRAEGRGDQVWAQVYGGSNDIEAKRSFDLLGESIDADLSHEVKSQGVQAGVDRAVPVENGALVFGMLAGAGKTELRFQNGDVTEYDGVGVGAYGHWFSGPLSIGVLAKLDTFKLDYDWAEANLKTRSDGFTVGARVDAAWRIAMGPNWHVEPQASLSWSDTALGRMKARDGAEVVFGDTTSMVGRIGVRAGGEMTVGNGLSFKPFAAVHALNEFEGDNASTLILGDQAVGVADRAHGAWGRAVLGASVEAPSGLGAFIQAEGDFGEVEGFTARAGVKFSW